MLSSKEIAIKIANIIHNYEKGYTGTKEVLGHYGRSMSDCWDNEFGSEANNLDYWPYFLALLAYPDDMKTWTDSVVKS
jgi:hypothetical protein